MESTQSLKPEGALQSVRGSVSHRGIFIKTHLSLSLTQCLNPELLWAYTFMADMCFEYADYGSDGTGD